MSRIAKSLFVLSCVLVFASCKQEGCTDPNALNYNVVADDDDGSCKYCTDEGPTQLAYVNYDLVDNRNWSEYYNQTIAKLEIYQREADFEYTDCGQSSCYFDMKVENVLEDDIYILQFNLTLQAENGFTYGLNQWQPLNILAGQDTLIQNIVISFPPQVCSPIIGTSGMDGQVNSAEYN